MGISNDDYLKIKRCIDNIMNHDFYNKILTEKEYYLVMSFIRASYKTVVGSRRFTSSDEEKKYYYSEGDCFNLKTKYKPFNKRLEKLLCDNDCLKITKFNNQYAEYELSYRDFILLITDGGIYLSNGTCTEEEMNEYIAKNGGNYITTPIIPSSSNKKYITRNDIAYKEWVENSLVRYNYTCQCCGSKQNPEVHHILNYAKYKELRTEVDNGIVLCECCHSPMIKGSFHNTYGTRNNTKEQLQEYVNNKREELGLEPKTI